MIHDCPLVLLNRPNMFTTGLLIQSFGYKNEVTGDEDWSTDMAVIRPPVNRNHGIMTFGGHIV